MQTLAQFREDLNRLLTQVPHLGTKTLKVKLAGLTTLQDPTITIDPDAGDFVQLVITEGKSRGLHQAHPEEVSETDTGVLGTGGLQPDGAGSLCRSGGTTLSVGGESSGDYPTEQPPSD